jgi:hypothetical protein
VTKEEVLDINSIGGGHWEYRSVVLKCLDQYGEVAAAPYKNALQDVEDFLELAIKKFKLNADLSDKQYDGDKVAPLDRIGIIEWLIDSLEVAYININSLTEDQGVLIKALEEIRASVNKDGMIYRIAQRALNEYEIG